MGLIVKRSLDLADYEPDGSYGFLNSIDGYLYEGMEVTPGFQFGIVDYDEGLGLVIKPRKQVR